MVTITVTPEQLSSLDLSPVQCWLEQTIDLNLNPIDESALATIEKQVQFDIQFAREEGDPRELSEIPEVRLWFIRLDSVYPWFPLCLDWQAGEFTRYAAMLVPHEFHRVDGIQFNPEALDLFIMGRVFVLADWLKKYQLPAQFRLKSLAQLLGYDLDENFLAQL